MPIGGHRSTCNSVRSGRSGGPSANPDSPSPRCRRPALTSLTSMPRREVLGYLLLLDASATADLFGRWPSPREPTIFYDGLLAWVASMLLTVTGFSELRSGSSKLSFWHYPLHADENFADLAAKDKLVLRAEGYLWEECINEARTMDD